LEKSTALQDVVINVSYASHPPTIGIEHFEKAPESAEDYHMSQDQLMKLREALNPDDMIVCVNIHRANPVLPLAVFVTSTRVLDEPLDGYRAAVASHPGFLPVSAWARPAAKSVEGKGLAFRVDEVDAWLFEAAITGRQISQHRLRSQSRFTNIWR